MSFRYAEGEPWVFEHFNLTVDSGESVAISAPSGAGKTTPAKLILGLLEPSEGEIRFGGIDIRKLGLARYRTQVGAVLQDDQLFAGSIADNISPPHIHPRRFSPVPTRSCSSAQARGLRSPYDEYAIIGAQVELRMADTLG